MCEAATVESRDGKQRPEDEHGTCHVDFAPSGSLFTPAKVVCTSFRQRGRLKHLLLLFVSLFVSFLFSLCTHSHTYSKHNWVFFFTITHEFKSSAAALSWDLLPRRQRQ